ncbi:MAG: hypothetical protein KatS3mg014_0834 [Actinomycetota bacterium]|nr:MAG: hypothetical protein KatS3mg014_0834 [Actinomycetota bacterium]
MAHARRPAAADAGRPRRGPHRLHDAGTRGHATRGHRRGSRPHGRAPSAPRQRARLVARRHADRLHADERGRQHGHLGGERRRDRRAPPHHQPEGHGRGPGLVARWSHDRVLAQPVRDHRARAGRERGRARPLHGPRGGRRADPPARGPHRRLRTGLVPRRLAPRLHADGAGDPADLGAAAGRRRTRPPHQLRTRRLARGLVARRVAPGPRRRGERLRRGRRRRQRAPQPRAAGGSGGDRARGSVDARRAAPGLPGPGGR